MDFLYTGIPLGRIFGARITLAFSHIIMLLILASGAREWGPIGMLVVGLVFFLSILLHELGHVLACKSVGGHTDQVILGPMGGLAAAQAPERPFPQFVTTAGGPAVNAILLAAAWGFMRVPAFTQLLLSDSQFSTVAFYFVISMILINKMLLVLNLLPIYPMDGGRLFQSLLWPMTGYRNSHLITGMVGTVGGVMLIVLGMGLWSINIPLIDVDFGGSNDYFLVFIGITCAMASWGVYQRAQQMDSWRKN